MTEIQTLSHKYIIITINFKKKIYTLYISVLTKNNHEKFYVNLKKFLKGHSPDRLTRTAKIKEKIATLNNTNFQSYYSNNSSCWASFELLTQMNDYMIEDKHISLYSKDFIRYLQRNIKKIYYNHINISKDNILFIDNNRIRVSKEHFIYINDILSLFKTKIAYFKKIDENREYMLKNPDQYISGTRITDELGFRITLAHPKLCLKIVDWIIKKDTKKKKTHSCMKHIKDFIQYHLDNFEIEQNNAPVPIQEILENDDKLGYLPCPDEVVISEINESETSGDSKNDDKLGDLPYPDEVVISENDDKLVKSKSLVLNEVSILTRETDGYINATQLCKAGGKLFGNYRKTKETKEFLEELSSNIHIRTMDLIKSNVGGSHSGTWVHRKVAYHIAQWISPKFSVQVSNWLDDLKENNDKLLKENNKLKQQYTLVDKSDKILCLNGVNILARKSDGYINLNQLCKAAGKDFKEWKRNKKSKAFLEAFEASVGIPSNELVKYKSGSNEERANWGHPQVAINVAQWISPKFDVQVSKWVFELMTTGKVELGKEKSQKELENVWKDMINPLKSLDMYDEKDVVYLFKFEPNGELMDKEVDDNKMYIKYGKSEGFKNRSKDHNYNKDFPENSYVKVIDMPNSTLR